MLPVDLFLILILSTLLFGADGDLDRIFWKNGQVKTDFDGAYDTAYSIAIQNDGKIVVAGDSQKAYE